MNMYNSDGTETKEYSDYRLKRQAEEKILEVQNGDPAVVDSINSADYPDDGSVTSPYDPHNDAATISESVAKTLHNVTTDEKYELDSESYEKVMDGANESSSSADFTARQFNEAFKKCREIFAAKLTDYGPSWRILRPRSVTDQIYIKAKRIRTLEESGISWVGEGIYPEYQAIVNYGIVALIQMELGFSDTIDMNPDDAVTLYDKYAKIAFELMLKKNHDYHEAWREMRTCSYTDFILVKLARVKQIEENAGITKISEGIDSNYLDMINYAIFGIIKIDEKNSEDA